MLYNFSSQLQFTKSLLSGPSLKPYASFSLCLKDFPDLRLGAKKALASGKFSKGKHIGMSLISRKKKVDFNCLFFFIGKSAHGLAKEESLPGSQQSFATAKPGSDPGSQELGRSACLAKARCFGLFV